jgi:hypothetical protein
MLGLGEWRAPCKPTTIVDPGSPGQGGVQRMEAKDDRIGFSVSSDEALAGMARSSGYGWVRDVESTAMREIVLKIGRGTAEEMIDISSPPATALFLTDNLGAGLVQPRRRGRDGGRPSGWGVAAVPAVRSRGLPSTFQ